MLVHGIWQFFNRNQNSNFFTLNSIFSVILVPMRPMFWHLRRRGIQIILFVINYGELADRALKYPMDGFITEIPQEMQDYLSK